MLVAFRDDVLQRHRLRTCCGVSKLLVALVELGYNEAQQEGKYNLLFSKDWRLDYLNFAQLAARYSQHRPVQPLGSW
jgi:hypothetical protein